MDASDKLEQDVVLQLNSSKRIADFADSLRPFLYHQIKNDPPGPIRSRVRKMELDRLIGLVSSTQKLLKVLMLIFSSSNLSKNCPSFSILTSTISCPFSQRHCSQI
jgi:hypothetical protein